MKTSTFLIILLYCMPSISCISQETNSDEPKKWTIGVNLNTVEPAYDFVIAQKLMVYSDRKDNSVCVGIHISKKVREMCRLRLALRGTRYQVDETYDDRKFSNPSSTYMLDTASAKQFVIGILPSCVWIAAFNNISFYGGLQIEYKNYGLIEGVYVVTEWDRITNDTLLYTRNLQTEEGGFSIGLGPVAGFSVKLFKNIQVGGEFFSSFSRYNLGGEVRSVKTNLLSGFVDSPYYTRQIFRGYNFSKITASLNISFSF